MNFELPAHHRTATIRQSDGGIGSLTKICFVKSASQILGNIFHKNGFPHTQASC